MGGSSPAQAGATASTIVTGGVMTILIISLAICLVEVVIARLEYRNYTYTFGEFDLIMKEGIIDKRENSIPYRQIQDVNVERNLAHQFMGLSRLVMRTAGHEESEEHEMAEIILEPIDKAMAEEIRTMLQRKVGVQIVEDEKVADREMASESAAATPPTNSQS